MNTRRQVVPALAALSPALLGAALLGQVAAGGAGAPAAAATPSSLTFDAQKYTLGSVVVDGRTVQYRAYENILYVTNPVDRKYQSMNVYVPVQYFAGQSVGGYTASTAPVFLPNEVGGYLPGLPGTPTTNMGGDAIKAALAHGYVVASPGARGRTGKDASGRFTGKAPAAIVDLKAAVAYLHFNDARMPGNAERIVSNGTSAGGALSALLGASGDNRDYQPYLKALGAAPASTAIYAVSAYCPITNLEHADAAYEWQFSGVNDYEQLKFAMDTDYKMQRTLVKGTLTAAQIAVSNDLKAQFIPYLNGLHLRNGAQPLTLDASGNGTFRTYVASLIRDSAQKALDAGTDLSKVTYLTVKDGRVTDVDFGAYARSILRMKTPAAFDGLSLENGENDEFGTATVAARHFTAYSQQHTAVPATQADPLTVKLMNPMAYVQAPGTRTAAHWRIRVGTADKDTSLAVSAILATTLRASGRSVDYALPWNVPHSGDYDLPELFRWIDTAVK